MEVPAPSVAVVDKCVCKIGVLKLRPASYFVVMLEGLQQGGEVVEVELLEAKSDGADQRVFFLHIRLCEVDRFFDP